VILFRFLSIFCRTNHEFNAFLYEKGKRKRKTAEMIEMERQCDSFYQSKQNRISSLEKKKVLSVASNRDKEHSLLHQSKQTEDISSGQNNSMARAGLQTIDHPPLLNGAKVHKAMESVVHKTKESSERSALSSKLHGNNTTSKRKC
jgi:hypothetical protein